MCGLKTVHKDGGPLLTKTCFDAGLLCVYAGNDPSVLQCKPALVITDDDAAWLVDTVRATFG